MVTFEFMSVSEFRPTIFFLLRFLGLYIVGNLIYGFYITSFEPRPDPLTHSVTKQTGVVLNICGFPVEVKDRTSKPTTDISYLGKSRLAVFEGCNGVNTMIIFLAFMIAFGPINKKLIWFILVGIIIIHLMNLFRITMLFLVSQYIPKAMYFTHKYFFTAILYVVIFALWFWWINKYALPKTHVGSGK